MGKIMNNEEKVTKIKEERKLLLEMVKNTISNNKDSFTEELDNLYKVLKLDEENTKKYTALLKAKDLIQELIEEILVAESIDDIIRLRKRLNYYINKVKKELMSRSIDDDSIIKYQEIVSNIRNNVAKYIRFLKRSDNISLIDDFSVKDELSPEEVQLYKKLIKRENSYNHDYLNPNRKNKSRVHTKKKILEFKDNTAHENQYGNASKLEVFEKKTDVADVSITVEENKDNTAHENQYGNAPKLEIFEKKTDAADVSITVEENKDNTSHENQYGNASKLEVFEKKTDVAEATAEKADELGDASSMGEAVEDNISLSNLIHPKTLAEVIAEFWSKPIEPDDEEPQRDEIQLSDNSSNEANVAEVAPEVETKKRVTEIIEVYKNKLGYSEADLQKLSADEIIANYRNRLGFTDAEPKKLGIDEIIEELHADPSFAGTDDTLSREEAFQPSVSPENVLDFDSDEHYNTNANHDFEYVLQRIRNYKQCYRIDRVYHYSGSVREDVITFFKNIPTYVHNKQGINRMIRASKFYSGGDFIGYIDYLRRQQSMKYILKMIFDKSYLYSAEGQCLNNHQKCVEYVLNYCNRRGIEIIYSSGYQKKLTQLQ